MVATKFDFTLATKNPRQSKSTNIMRLSGYTIYKKQRPDKATEYIVEETMEPIERPITTIETTKDKQRVVIGIALNTNEMGHTINTTPTTASSGSTVDQFKALFLIIDSLSTAFKQLYLEHDTKFNKMIDAFVKPRESDLNNYLKSWSDIRAFLENMATKMLPAVTKCISDFKHFTIESMTDDEIMLISFMIKVLYLINLIDTNQKAVSNSLKTLIHPDELQTYINIFVNKFDGISTIQQFIDAVSEKTTLVDMRYQLLKHILPPIKTSS